MLANRGDSMKIVNMSKLSTAAYIKDILNKCMKKEIVEPLRKKDLHNLLQDRLVGLAVDFGLTGNKEYKLYVSENKSLGNIDVVWENDRLYPVVSIEIDSSARRKSIKKLLASKSYYKFWICYGKKKFIQALNKYDYHRAITFIYLPKIKCIGKRAIEGYKYKYNMMVYE